MLLKKLLKRFAKVSNNLEEKFNLAERITKEASADIFKTLSSEEVGIAVEAILLSLAISQGVPPSISLLGAREASEIFSKTTGLIAKEIEE